MGKGWAKGLTAATDPRVAARAEAHRGKRYVRRKPPGDCAWPGGSFTTRALQWSEEMAYFVGLTATDGCLLTNRKQINFKSMDRELVRTYLDILGRTNKIHERRTRLGHLVYVTQFGDARLYEWLVGVGLTPRKSLTLGALGVPDAVFLPVARGLLDGDGSIINKTYRADTGRRDDYYWEWLLTKFNSASRAHLEWLAERLSVIVGLSGDLRQQPAREGRHDFWTLIYGKRSSRVLLPLLYPDGAPCLERKRAIWTSYAARHPLE